MGVADIIVWIVFGALVGWIASMIMKTNQEQGALANVGIGILGAVIGGWVGSLFGFGQAGAFTIGGLIFSVLGAVILIAVLKMFRQKT